MRLFPAFLVAATLLGGEIAVLGHLRDLQEQETLARQDASPGAPIPPQPTRAPWLIAAAVLATGLIVFTGCWFVPAFAESVGNQIFLPDTHSVEKSPYAPAISLTAQGDYPRAVALYLAMLEENPSDTHAALEASRLLLDKLDNPPAAAHTLRLALSAAHPAEDTARMAFLLADLLQHRLHDPAAAHALLQSIIETMPGTPHAQRAQRMTEQA